MTCRCHSPFCPVYCGWREGLTIQEIIAEQRRRLGSANPAERLAAALLIPNVLTERLRDLHDCQIGELLEHEVYSNLSVLAPELTVWRLLSASVGPQLAPPAQRFGQTPDSLSCKSTPVGSPSA
jgi:hypothetical protein